MISESLAWTTIVGALVSLIVVLWMIACRADPRA